MNWRDEIRKPEFEQLENKPRNSIKELKMARQFIDQLTSQPAKFEDTYRLRLEEAIDAKIDGNEIAVEPAGAEPAMVTGLLEALKASVETRARTSA